MVPLLHRLHRHDWVSSVGYGRAPWTKRKRKALTNSVVYKAKAACGIVFSPAWSSLCVRFVVRSDTGIWYPWPGVLCMHASYLSPIWTSHQNPSPSLSRSHRACVCMDEWMDEREIREMNVLVDAYWFWSSGPGGWEFLSREMSAHAVLPAIDSSGKLERLASPSSIHPDIDLYICMGCMGKASDRAPKIRSDRRWVCTVY